MFAVFKARIWMEHVNYSFRPHVGAARALATGNPRAFFDPLVPCPPSRRGHLAPTPSLPPPLHPAHGRDLRELRGSREPSLHHSVEYPHNPHDAHPRGQPHQYPHPNDYHRHHPESDRFLEHHDRLDRLDRFDRLEDHPDRLRLREGHAPYPRDVSRDIPRRYDSEDYYRRDEGLLGLGPRHDHHAQHAHHSYASEYPHRPEYHPPRGHETHPSHASYQDYAADRGLDHHRDDYGPHRPATGYGDPRESGDPRDHDIVRRHAPEPRPGPEPETARGYGHTPRPGPDFRADLGAVPDAVADYPRPGHHEGLRRGPSPGQVYGLGLGPEVGPTSGADYPRPGHHDGLRRGPSPGQVYGPGLGPEVGPPSGADYPRPGHHEGLPLTGPSTGYGRRPEPDSELGYLGRAERSVCASEYDYRRETSGALPRSFRDDFRGEGRYSHPQSYPNDEAVYGDRFSPGSSAPARHTPPARLQQQHPLEPEPYPSERGQQTYPPGQPLALHNIPRQLSSPSGEYSEFGQRHPNHR